MTKQLVKGLIWVLGDLGGNRADFEYLFNFDSKKLDSWMKRLLKKFVK